MSFKDQARRRRVAEKRGRRGNRRAQAMLLRQAVLHPVVIGFDPGSGDAEVVATFDSDHRLLEIELTKDWEA